jgi:predicted RNA binding protein YcfA (HicA-like mRNA interferase family)
MTQKAAIKLLESFGWWNAEGGKHVVKMTKPGHRPVTLPAHKRQEYGAGLTRSILKQAGLLDEKK